MSNRVLCKYFAHGACLKGDYCEFSHDWSTPSSNICTYYQKGICSYGSRCRYEHVKASQPPSYTPSVSSNHHSPLASGSFSVNNGTDSLPSQEELTSYRSLAPPETPAWNLNNLHHHDYYGEGNGIEPRNETPAWNLNDFQHQDYYGEGDVVESRNIEPSERSLCSFAAVGNCPRGEKCPHIHGDLCPTCGKHCLHPFRPEEREEHMAMCMKKQKQLEALKLSQEIECSVCLEPVLSKSSAAERKFGILSECDHPFCISCIRNWRSTSPTPGIDLNSALRACPICRKLSYFIIPSVIWYTSKEEKQEIMDTYKAKLKSIDCKHFDFGNGGCPFGTSCFYKHAYRDGSLEEVVLRHLSAEDGQTVIAKDIRLSDFLSDLRLR